MPNASLHSCLLFLFLIAQICVGFPHSVSFHARCGHGRRFTMMARATPTSVTALARNDCRRRLIVDTDLGLDDLVALALLRVHQCLPQRTRDAGGDGNRRHTPFRLVGVTITPGISHANEENAALLRRLLPPGTPVYVAGTPPSRTDGEKPTWWTRTAGRVASFLSSLPPSPGRASGDPECADVAAEEFVANNLDDPDVDFLCMAPLTTVARAMRLRSELRPDGPPSAAFYVMGGIRSDSKVTKRGVSTAPFGYHDVVGGGAASEEKSETSGDGRDRFGEFNFALDVAGARAVLSTASAHIIPLEACTLVPESHRHSAAGGETLSSTLSRSGDLPSSGDYAMNKELYAARGVLLQLLRECGTDETQWDSIAAAIYCGALGSVSGNGGRGTSLTRVDSGRLSLSDLGALSFPGCRFDEAPDAGDDCGRHHRIHSAFSMDDESAFFRYLSFLLYSDTDR